MSESPATILVVSDRRDDRIRIDRLLGESGIPAQCVPCRDLEELRTNHAKFGADLIAFRFESAEDDATGADRFRKTLDDSPGLILLTEGATPEDYLRAGKASADNLTDLDMPAQFDFTLRKELEHTHLRRLYREARARLEEERVIDDSEFSEPGDSDSLPPMVEAIDHALENDRMELLFQPILSVADAGHENHEVFLRIQGNDGYLMPGDFLPVAERYGLMPAIDRWVVERAIARFAKEQDRREHNGGGRLRFFLNISLHSLVDPVAIREIVGNIRKAGLPAGSFVIELDKNTILSRLKMSKALNRHIKDMKLQFAMDHYDIDDNSLNYLKHVRLDFIKLNQSLIRDVHTHPERRDHVREIVSRVHESGIQVVASQVEKASELAMLYDAGVDHVQGYLIAEPSSELQEGIALDEIRA